MQTLALYRSAPPLSPSPAPSLALLRSAGLAVFYETNEHTLHAIGADSALGTFTAAITNVAR